MKEKMVLFAGKAHAHHILRLQQVKHIGYLPRGHTINFIYYQSRYQKLQEKLSAKDMGCCSEVLVCFRKNHWLKQLMAPSLLRSSADVKSCTNHRHQTQDRITSEA